MNVSVPDQRLAQNIASTLRWTNLDENGEEVVASGAVTVTVVRADGTSVLTNAAATLDSSTTGTYTAGLTVAQMASLDLLTATWSVGGVAVATTRIEIVGSLAFTIAQARNITEISDYSTADLAFYRLVVETEAEWICGRAFAPSYRRLTLDGPADITIAVPDYDLRRVVSGSMDGTALTNTQIGRLQLYDLHIDTTWGDVWHQGQRNVILAYEYGLDAWPATMKAAALIRMREIATANGPGARSISARATSMQANGATIQLDQASEFETGNPDVDAVYGRWSKRVRTGADGKDGAAPYAREINFDPQWNSLYHGGPR